MAHIDATAANPLDQFETHAELFAFLYQKYGAKPLRQCLAEVDDLTCESLEGTAAELIEMELPKVAEIVAEFAANAPSRLSQCPYDEGSTNAKAWLAAEQNRLRMKRPPQD